MSWFAVSLEQVWIIALSCVAIYFVLIVFIKINGLRSFSKMSAHDFAVTIAIGSVFAGVVLQKQPSILQGIITIAMMFLLQSIYSRWRMYSPSSLLENKPLLLMENGKILDDNLSKAKLTEQDLIAKLREANVLKLDDVRAVVFEATGDVSVLHGGDTVDDKLLSDVQR